MDVRPPSLPSRKRRRRLALLRRRLFVLVIAIAVIAIGANVAAQSFHGVAPAIPTATPLPAPPPPYSSAFVRRGAAWNDVDAARVRRLASPIVNGASFPSTSAVILIDARSGGVLYEHNVHMPLVPASTMKLITAGTALHDLGPDFRFQTELVTDGTVGDGAIHGDVYLVGGGDPELSTADIQSAVRQLRREGIRRIDGGVVSDGTLYGPDEVNSTWDPEDLEYGWAAPPSAITIDNGAVQFTIWPDPGLGLATVAVDPPAAGGRIVGHIRTVSVDGDNSLRIDPLPDGSGFSLSGHIPYGEAQKYWRSIAHPTDVAATVFRAVALGGGVAMSGAASSGKAPSGASTALWSHRSRPLASIVQHMAFDSDNHIAEQLLRAAGAQAVGTGTLDNGVAAEHAYLASLGADDANSDIVDGSGLSAANRVTAASLGAVLRAMLAGPDAQREVALLPRIGLEGTVHFRSIAPDIVGRVRGKDGYIAGASGLAGFVETAHHGVVVYAFLVDDWQQGLDAIWNGEDEILARLARM